MDLLATVTVKITWQCPLYAVPRITGGLTCFVPGQARRAALAFPITLQRSFNILKALTCSATAAFIAQAIRWEVIILVVVALDITGPGVVSGTPVGVLRSRVHCSCQPIACRCSSQTTDSSTDGHAHRSAYRTDEGASGRAASRASASAQVVVTDFIMGLGIEGFSHALASHMACCGANGSAHHHTHRASD